MGIDNVAVLLVAAVLITIHGIKGEKNYKVNETNNVQSTTAQFNPLANLILNASRIFEKTAESKNILNRVKRQYSYYPYGYGRRQYYPLVVFGGLGGFGPGIGFPGRGFGAQGFGGRGFGFGVGSRGFGGRGFGGQGIGLGGRGFGGRGFGGGFGGGRGGRG